jgi:hypothetical protein
MSFYSSTFYSDGYQDACAGRESCPPSGVFGQEYIQGFLDGSTETKAGHHEQQ